MRAALDTSALQSAVERLGKDSLGGVRDAALARFLASGLPTTKQEQWKYTSLAGIAELSHEWLADAAVADRPDAGLPAGVDAHRLPIRNGRIDDSAIQALNSALGGAAAVQRLSVAADAPGVYMGDALSSLNAALMNDAVCIRVASTAVVDKPIVLDLFDATGERAATSQVRLIIRLEPGASASFIELHRSTGEYGHFASVVTELDVGAGAQACYGRIQERAETHTLISRVQAHLGENSRLQHAAIDLGGGLVRNDLAAVLAATGAELDTSGFFLADGRQHIDNHVFADHAVGPTTSRQNYRGIASGRARCVYNGKALVREAADGTDAEQSSHNLLLSDKAEIDTKPELEIYAEDVKCSHGATVGQLDERALFYLRSRGIERQRARQLLIRAFAGEILAAFPIPALCDYLEQAIERRLDRVVEGQLI